MSQFEHGFEEIGLGSGQANALYNANLQRLVREFREEEAFHFVGNEAGFPNIARTLSVRPYDRVVKGVRIRIDGTVHATLTLTVKLMIGAVVKANSYIMPAATSYVDLPVVTDGNGGAAPFSVLASDPQSGNGMLVLATEILKVQVITTFNTFADIWIYPYWRPRVL